MKYEQTLHTLTKTNDTINEYISSLCNKINNTNPSLHAFLHEEGREQRLRKNASIFQDQAIDNLPLFGLSVGVKDILYVDGLPTRAGSQLPLKEFHGKQADIVTQLKKAGALIVGKTVTTEFATGGTPTETRNPVNLDYSPGGSSSGSAAAVAAGLCEIAIGSQTIGSVLRPASYCSVVGFKGSFGRITTNGIIHFAPSLDTIGFFSKTVSKLIPAIQMLLPSAHTSSTDKKPIIGIPIGTFLEQADKEILQVFNNITKKLESNGYIIKPVILYEDISTINHDLWTLATYELAEVHKEWYIRYKDKYHPKTQELIEKGKKVSEKTHQKMITKQKELRETIEKKMSQYGIDLWICPAASTYAPKMSEKITGNPVMNIPWTFAGLPSISLPIKQSGNLPLGLQVVSPFGSDELLLQESLYLERIIN